MRLTISPEIHQIEPLMNFLLPRRSTPRTHSAGEARVTLFASTGNARTFDFQVRPPTFLVCLDLAADLRVLTLRVHARSAGR